MTSDSTPLRVGVVGAGIVGLAVAREVTRRLPGSSSRSSRRRAGSPRTRPGATAASCTRVSTTSRARSRRRCAGAASRCCASFCAEHGVAYRELGKLVVALDAGEVPALDEIERRARGNGVPDLVRLDAHGLREIEPHVEGVAALHSPRTAVVDYVAVCAALVDEVTAAGGTVELSAPVTELAGGRRRRARRRGRTHVPLRPGDRLRRPVERLARADGGRSRRPAHRPVPRGVLLPRARTRRRWCAGSCIPCRTRATRSSASTSPAASTTPCTSVPTPCSRWRARATADATSTSPTCATSRPGRGRGASQVRTGAAGSARWPAPRRGASTPVAYAATSRRSSRGDMTPVPAGVRAQAVDRAGRLVDDFALVQHGRVLVLRNAPVARRHLEPRDRRAPRRRRLPRCRHETRRLTWTT